jgi:hypothetical protein
MANVRVAGANKFTTPGALKATDSILRGTNPVPVQASCIIGFNTHASTTYYIQVYDLAAVPANGAFDANTRPILWQAVAYPQSPWSIDMDAGWRFANGILVVKSTACDQLTREATADQIINISALRF